MYIVTAKEMQQMDSITIKEFGIPGRVLMENAGRDAAKILVKNFVDILYKKIGVVAGSGNNGGDGFVIARYLATKGYEVTVYLLAKPEKVKGEAKENLNLLYLLEVPVVNIPDHDSFIKHKDSMTGYDIWVDAILGTGLKSDVRDYLKQIIKFINGLNKSVLAVDIPSGLNSETGQVQGACIRADYTATFGAAKIGQKLFPGADLSGKVEVIDIGIPPYIVEKVAPLQYLITPDYVKSEFLPRKPDAHKGNSGHLLVIAGSCGKTGAVILAAMSAMRIGAGLVTMAVPESINSVIEAAAIEAMTWPISESKLGILGASAFDSIEELFKGKKCIAIGPGIGIDSETVKLVCKILSKSTIPIVMDADALNCISQNTQILKTCNANVVLTPHPGEMARLIAKDTSYVQKDRVGCARDFAKEFNVHLVLKGAGTVIATPDGRVFVNCSGNCGMASGGMGDVLTGMISGLITQGYSLETAVNIGVYLHGAAADSLSESVGKFGFIASDVVDAIPYELKKFTSNEL
eukprot:CAMPEP_0201282542 /NCGR_PEP_ID=MMETSP1317-20130820/5913_1 /ASSEMBLY_ACC=CAM_ASM_000770 /TAXON_ID=187299 /ORGANISM="Undescribed Undescribed, Strain Undescribed" /LENGTH=519 /DNA_ID=CAMNT_0047595515 /DNA_START=1783 /DNA_END=3342 /DNA_ORIENTATION=+